MSHQDRREAPKFYKSKSYIRPGLGAALAGGNPKHGRQPRDFYPTPPDVVEALVNCTRKLLNPITHIWEPCAGNGSMVRALRKYVPHATIIGSDLNPLGDEIVCFDALLASPMRLPAGVPFLSPNKSPHKQNKQIEKDSDTDSESAPSDPKLAIITNPPFSLAHQLIPTLLALDPAFMAMVLKATYWHAATRLELFRNYQPNIIMPLTWRPDFMAGGAPTMDIIWCVWTRAGRWSAELKGVTFYVPLQRPIHSEGPGSTLASIASAVESGNYNL